MEESDLDVGEKDPLVGHGTQGTKSSSKLSRDLGPNREVTRKGHEKKRKETKRKNVKESSKQGYKRSEGKNESEKSKTSGMKNTEKSQVKGKETPTLACPFFGVKNYLHQFYEKAEVKNKHIYEETPLPQDVTEAQESIFLVKRREGLCSSSVFRLSLMLGGIILMMGTTALIVAGCASRRATLVGKVGGVAVVDRVAAAHNAEVDALFLVALIALTLGATVVASALVSRAFCRGPEYEDGYREGVLESYDSIYKPPPFLHPSEKKVPVTEEITQIQPWIGSNPFTYR